MVVYCQVEVLKGKQGIEKTEARNKGVKVSSKPGFWEFHKGGPGKRDVMQELI